MAVRAEDDLARFEVLAAACRSRRTTPQRLADEVRARRRLVGRDLLLAMLDDLASGACSVLEREYLRLEEAHGLPPGARQQAIEVHGRAGYQDVAYPRQAAVVELDGRTTHGDDRVVWDDDHERDLRTMLDRDSVTVRLTYGQVFRHGCRTIAAVAELLSRRGWDGELVRCPGCADDPAPAESARSAARR